MNRRQFSTSLLQTVGSYSLLKTLFTSGIVSSLTLPYSTNKWLKELHEMAMDLKDGTVSPAQWQQQIEQLLGQVPFSELITAIDFEKLTEHFTYPDLGVHTKKVHFPQLDGLPKHLAFYSKIFGMKKDRAVIPHGHKNMASCHYVLKGALQLKHYDKIQEDETHMIIEPTIDELAEVGSYSSISDEKNNIHWLKATTETAFTYDVIVLNVLGEEYEVNNIDPYDAEMISGNQLRVRKLDVQEALEKYGHDVHH